jgi:hypothetical protein
MPRLDLGAIVERMLRITLLSTNGVHFKARKIEQQTLK